MKSIQRSGAADRRPVWASFVRKCSVAAIAATLILVFADSASAAYVQRYVTTTRGALTFTGNTLGLGRGSATAPGLQDSIGAFTTINTALQVGTYPAGTTTDWHLNSSSAILVLPAGATVLHAELIWGSTYNTGGQNVTASIATPVTLTAPAQAPISVTPAPAAAQLGGGRYVNAADVTATVQAAGAGTYTVGGVPGVVGNDATGNATGWTLAVAYADPTKPVRNLTIYASAEVGGAAAVQVTGFCTPSTGAVSGRALVTAVEGDTVNNGDTFLFGPSATLTNANRLSGPNNPITNFFVSQMNKDDGTLDTSGTFGSLNQNAAGASNVSGGRQGWDITNVDASSQLTNNQTSAFAQGTTSGDQYTIAGLGLQIDVFAPSFPVTVKQVDHTSTFVGDILTYTITLNNTGGSTATSVVFNDPVPANTSFVAGSFKIDNVAQPAVLSPVGVSLGSIANGAQKVVTFQVHVDSLPASRQITNSANWTYNYTACTTTLPGSVTTNEVSTPMPVADLSITKTDGSAAATPGGAISYTIVASNAGTSTATGALVTDTIPAGILGATWTATYAGGATGPASGGGNISASVNLPSGASATFIVNGTVDPNATGTLANTAAIAAPSNITDPNTGNNSATDTDTLAPQANLGITKTDGATSAIPGSPITYTIVASNAGPSNASGATVADLVPAGIVGATWTCVGAAGGTCPASGSGNINASVNLPSGGSVTFTVSGTISATATGTLSNTATVAVPAGVVDPTPGNNSATDTDSLTPQANLAITKTDGASSATPGSGISYTIVASNAGPSTATGATITDTIPASISGATWTAVYAGGASGPASGSGNISALVNLPTGGSATFTVSGTISSTATGTLSNTATVAAPAGVTDPTPGNNSATDSDTLNPSADLSISKTDGSATYTPGSPITYTIVAGNSGPSSATGATVTDTIPANITGATWTATYAGSASGPASGSGNIGATVNLPVGGSATFVVTGTVSASATGSLINTAAIATPAGTTDPTPGNNSATDTDNSSPQANLGITKTDGAGTAQPGASISYTIVASNTGPSNVTGATVADTIPASITGATWTCVGAGGGTCPASGSGNISASVTLPVGGTATFIVNGTISPTATGTLANTATITVPGGTVDPTPGNNTATDTDTLNPTADLSITKTDSATNAVPGNAISYTIVASNAGPSTATGATVADTIPANITGATWTAVYAGGASGPASGSGNINASVTLPASGTATFTVSGTISASATGTLANTATITAPAGVTDPTSGNNSATDSDTLNPTADIRVVKTGTASVGFGGALSYQVAVSNLGPSNANGTTFTDTLPAGLTGVTAGCAVTTGTAACGTVTTGATTVTSTITTLASGATVTFTINATAPTSGTSITNSATANPPAGTSDPNTGNNTGTATTTLLQPQLTVTKTATPNPFTVGQPASYTITVSNTGAGPTAGNITVADTLPAAITLQSASGTNWSCTGVSALSCTYTGTIAAGGSTTLTLNVTVAAGAANANNSATASGGGDPTCPAASRCTGTTTVPVNPSADIAVSKSVDNASPNVGENVTFTVTVTNNGPNNASGVAISDALPSGVSFVSATPSQGTYNSGTGLWTVGALANGASATLDITATVLTQGGITNTATKSAGDQFDPNTGNNAGSASLNALPSADLQVTKTVDNATPNLGTNVTYTVTVTNAGPNDATNVSVDDLLPAGLVFVSATASQGIYDDNVGLWTIGSVAAGDSVTLQIVATVTLPGDITNTATVDADEHDPNGANNTGGVTLNGQSADIQVVKGVDNANPVRGDQVTFTITATNNGPSAATGVVINDLLPVGLSFVSATASQGTYDNLTGAWTIGAMAASGAGATKTLTIVADVDTDSGFTNTASLGAIDQTDPNPANNSSSVVVTPIASADLAITKTDGSASATPGASITYTIVASNAGPSPAVGATVIDNLPVEITGAGWTCVGASGASCTVTSGSGDINATVDIPVGGSVTFTVTGTVAANASGTLANTTTIAPPVGSNDPDSGNNSATDSDALQPSANLSISKTDGSGTATPGSPISYTIVASNAGPSDVVGATVTDTLPVAISGASWTCVASGAANCPAGGVGNINAVVDIPAGENVTFTVTGTVAPGATGTLANTATIAPPVGTIDPNPGDDSSTDNDNLAPQADLSITKTDGATSATPGLPISYTIVASNAGPSTAANAIVADAIPATIVGASWTCVGSGAAICPANGSGSINANVTIPPGDSVTFTVNGTVSAAASGSLVNTATVTAPVGTADPNTGNNSATDTDALAASANLSITKTDSATTATPGNTITYTITASNAGPSDANGATVADTLPASITAVTWGCTGSGGGTCPATGSGNINATVNLPAGGSVTFLVSGTINAGATGSLSNTATVAAPPGVIDPTPADNSATDTDTLTAVADLLISKTDGSASATPGSPISYTITASNAGPSNANGATVADTLPAAITGATWTCMGAGGGTCPATGSGNISATVNLPAGASVTFVVTGTVSASATGTLSNTATVAVPGGVTDPTPGNNSATDTDTLSASADLLITKTDGNASATPGSPITYTITASNAGPSDAPGATVVDALPATISGATWSCTGAGGGTCPTTGNGNINATVNLPAGASVTFLVTGTVSASATGTLTNTATVAAPGGVTDPTPGNNSATDTDTLSANADLSITKTDGSATATPGSVITYTITAGNAGPSDVTGATVADTLPAAISGATWSCSGAAGGTCPASGNGSINATVNLPAGGSVTFIVTGTVSASATGTLANTATVAAPGGVTDPTPGNNSATDTDTLTGSADIEAHKTGPANVTAGATIAYSVIVTNHGPSDANGTTFSDTVPAGISGVTASCGTPSGGASCGAVNVAGNAVTSAITTMPSGASVTFTISGTAPADPGTLSNTANAQPPAGIDDPATGNNSSSVTTAVDASADVSIAKSGPSTVASGAAISYTLVVSNAGPSAADGTTWADNVPAAITGVTASCGSPIGGATCAPPTVAGNNVSGSVPNLPAGGSVTITISGDAPFGSQSFTNTATVAGPVGVPDPDSANNSSSVTTSIGAAADIALTKTVDNAAPNVGQTVTFTITARNDGPNDATGIAVTDSLPFGFGLVSATPSVGTYVPATGLWTIGALANGDSATLLIVASIDVPGALTNTVAVSAADQPDPNTSNNSAGASVNAGASADIAVAKSVDNPTPNVGATITYTVTASNNGPNDATGVEITDNLPAGTTFVSATPSQGTYASGVWSAGSLANGTSATLAISATVDAPGSIVNTATITHEDQFDPVGANNQAGATINGQQADLGVTKTVDDASPNVGDSVTFTVTVHNSGPSDATGVTLADALPAGLVFVSSTPSQGTYDNLGGVWTVGTLTAAGAGSSATLTIVADVAASGAMTNTATVSGSDQPDPNAANNSASASLNGNPLADLVVSKSGPATVTPGDDVVYTVVVTNNGPSDASNVVVADATPAGLVFVSNAGACATTYPCTLPLLASGASATITTTYTVPADYAGANPIVNTASATASEPDPNTANNQSSASTGVGAGNADLSIVKSGPASVASGGAIGYTLLITNNGPSPANGAVYTDVVPASISTIVAACGGEAGGASCGTQPTVSGNTVSGTIGNLPSGGSVLVAIDGVAPSGPASLSNTATIEPPGGVVDPVSGNNSSSVSTTVAATSANLAVEKLGPASAVPGANITYTITVTNNGPDTAMNAVLSDPTPAGLAFVSASPPCGGGFPCAIGDFPSGASTIISVTYAVDAGASGSVQNTATVGSDTPDPDSGDNTSMVTTPVVAAVFAADLALVKTGPADVTAGNNVVYTVVVTNNGPDAAANVVVTDPTPAGLLFVGNSGACASAYPCALGTLASGASASITSTYAVPASYAGANPVVNTAAVGSDTPDPNGGDNVGSVSTVVMTPTLSADLSIIKSGSPAADPGTSVTYTIVVTNNGPDAVPDPVLSDPTPAGLNFVSASGACAGGFPCTLAALPAGATATITATYLVVPTFSGTIANVASVTSTTVPDPTPNNNSVTATTVVVGAPGTPTQPVPVDARWMLILMAAMLMLVGAPLARRRR
jgi:uncharacterized repeat protein (TIGR01451 family)